MTFSVFTFSATLSAERQGHKDSSRFYDYMAENIRGDDMFIFPANQLSHLTAISAYLFPGHVQISKVYSGTFYDWYLQALETVHVDYDAFNADAYNGRSAWIIIMDTDNDGKPIDFTPDDGTELIGNFR
jgi:hypothetical protein